MNTSATEGSHVFDEQLVQDATISTDEAEEYRELGKEVFMSFGEPEDGPTIKKNRWPSSVALLAVAGVGSLVRRRR